MIIWSKITDFLSNKYLILLVFIICTYFAFNTFESVDEQKNSINVSIIQKTNTNSAEKLHNPTFKVEHIAIDNKIPNPFLSGWLRQKSIEEKKRLEAEAEAKRIEAARRKAEQEKKMEQERLAKQKDMEDKKNNLKQSPAPKPAAPKPAPRPKEKKQFRYIGHTQVNNQELILVEVLENQKIHYINKDQTIENYKVKTFNSEQLELIKDDKTFIIKRGNIVLLEI